MPLEFLDRLLKGIKKPSPLMSTENDMNPFPGGGACSWYAYRKTRQDGRKPKWRQTRSKVRRKPQLLRWSCDVQNSCGISKLPSASAPNRIKSLGFEGVDHVWAKSGTWSKRGLGC
ncbi:hypothetical protein PIB30_093997 [Stylosanthes scabra]|uniref:Uncharacterized protein n=1 Tax=Stylosanthes scabra TaxID=79078 RepID=A0ABU6WWH0_9FABA|nr:hypothetical protein [Stylosanthes scabra]